MATTISTTKAIYENGVFRPLEQLDLPERGAWRIVILPVDDEEEEPVQETLADVLGFDPGDEVKVREMAESQHQALQELMDGLAGLPGSASPHDGAVNHDKYIYRVGWR